MLTNDHSLMVPQPFSFLVQGSPDTGALDFDLFIPCYEANLKLLLSFANSNVRMDSPPPLDDNLGTPV